MFRLFCVASLSGGLLVCGSVVRSATLSDLSGAVEVAACGGCGSAVVTDPATGRRGPCGCGDRRELVSPPARTLASR